MEYYPSTFEFSGYVFREDSFGVMKRLRFLLQQIEAARGRFEIASEQVDILDVGCGTGISVTIPLSRYGYQLTGIDINKASINKANMLARDIPNVSFRWGDLAAIEEEAQFHIVICSEVLEHIEEPENVLAQIAGRLRNGGVLLVTVPNGYGYFELESLVHERFPGVASYLDARQQAIVRRFGRKSLRERHKIERSPAYCDMALTTLDDETEHCNHFTPRKIRRLLRIGGFRPMVFRNRTLLAGNIINILLRESDTLLKWNGMIADYLPRSVCSGWMIAARKSIS